MTTYELGQVCADPRAVAVIEQIVRAADDTTILRHARRALRSTIEMTTKGHSFARPA